MQTVKTQKNLSTSSNVFKFLVYSAIGIFMFFVPIKIKGNSTIPIDHIVNYIRALSPTAANLYAIIIIVLGGLYPFIKGTWNKDAVSIVFSILKLLGIVVGFMAFFKVGPAWMFEKDMVPFLFDKLVISVGIIVPIGSAFLAFLVGYGLMEFVGVLMQPIMRPVWKTPGSGSMSIC